MTETHLLRERLLTAAREAGRRFVQVWADELLAVLEPNGEPENDADAEGGTAAEAEPDAGGDSGDAAPEREVGR